MDEQQETRTVRREYGQPTSDSIGQARRVIDQIENRINDSHRGPMSKTLSIVDTGEIIDLIGQLRIVLPHTVVQAQAILDQQKQIIGDAKAEADKTADTAESTPPEKPKTTLLIFCSPCIPSAPRYPPGTRRKCGLPARS